MTLASATVSAIVTDGFSIIVEGKTCKNGYEQ